MTNGNPEAELSPISPIDGLSLIIPAYNEEGGIESVLDDAKAVLREIGIPHEIIVVDDSSRDATGRVAEASGVRVLRNIQNGGYGYSLMRGVTAAKYATVAIIDADGSYPVEEFTRLFDEYRRGFAMVVGNREGAQYDGTTQMKILRWAFRSLTQFIVGRSVPDVNSGMRIFDRAIVMPLFPHMSYGFSFTTSITLLFMMRALPVSYVPVAYRKRHGESKVRYFRDSLRALQILTSITARLNPIKLFLLAAGINAVVMLPLVLLLSLWGGGRLMLVLVLETSAILVALGFVVEALVEKRPR
ncbi:MAG TPA: glycosyltransferase family 2 protein [Candidatus Limnocylindrales bacterium]|nr:glycosyltransferase family 2 protein [Candidatus Limnocylindrales bacterium]